ncbi:MAG: UDP-N-acetylglucosamine 1-carboxyvinyltransferase [Actinomycetota bacterium]
MLTTPTPQNTLTVQGGRRLEGSVRVSGAKNSALKLMAGALLAEGTTEISNVPRIEDCRTMVEVLEHLGASVEWNEDACRIDTSGVSSFEAPYELVSKMRASIIVLGPLLTRFGRATVAMPGGCNIGSRNIDLHVRGLEQMGARFRSEHGYLYAETDAALSGAVINLDFPSVGATENVLMAGVGARGTTVIENAAREPEIVDLAGFLTGMGAQISGAGTTTIEIQGVDRFDPVTHRVIPDRIETATLAVAAAATRGDIVLQGARSHDLDLALAKLSEAGVAIEPVEGGLRVRAEDRPRAVDFVTLPYPGFPTDIQPQMMTLLAAADGTSIATENVFESRFMFVDELKRMGADIQTEGHHAVIRGVDRLSAAPVRALDIRAGAAIVIAALVADGVTEIGDMHFVDRGYEDFEAKLTGLGAEVHRERALEPSSAG